MCRVKKHNTRWWTVSHWVRQTLLHSSYRLEIIDHFNWQSILQYRDGFELWKQRYGWQASDSHSKQSESHLSCVWSPKEVYDISMWELTHRKPHRFVLILAWLKHCLGLLLHLWQCWSFFIMLYLHTRPFYN